jgi:hypothetical protein
MANDWEERVKKEEQRRRQEDQRRKFEAELGLGASCEESKTSYHEEQEED